MNVDHGKMESSNFEDHVKLSIPHNIYNLNLKTINNIPFTSREIDIISCIVRGRRPSKIASLLSITVKNVENRIAGIKSKIGCGTPEGIIDFIEKSGKYELVHNHGSNLLIQCSFEKILKQISVRANGTVTCSVIYDRKSKIESSFVRQIKKHLQQANIKILTNEGNNSDINANSLGLKNHYTICCLSKKMVETKTDVLKTIKVSNEGQNPVILISARQDAIHLSKERLEDINCIDLTGCENYYFLILDILKHFHQTGSLDKYCNEFKQQCLAASGTIEKKESMTNQLLPNSTSNEKVEQNKKQAIKWWVACSVLISLVIGFYIYRDTNRTNSAVNENSYSIDTISRIEAKEICKLPSPCEYFSGREIFIQKIKKLLNENRKVVIVGYQGIGKTQVAYQYAKLNERDYPGGMYIIKADSPQILINSIRSLAIAMGVVSENWINQLNDDQIRKITVPILQKHLEQCEKMLFVIDNVNNYDDIKDIIGIQSKQHHVILTSSKKQWDAWDFLELREFDQKNQEAEYLILKILKNESPKNAEKLAKKLGYYPLAITQAVNYLKNNDIIKIDDYLREYETLLERRKAFLNYQSFEQNNYVKTALTAFEISKGTLIKEFKESYNLLKLCAFFSHDIIPMSIFSNEIKNYRSALEVLNKYSLLEISNINGELFINMHNILRDNIKIQMHEVNEESKIEEKVINLFDKYLNYDFWDNKNIERFRLTMPHIDHLINYMINKKSDLIKSDKFISLLSKSGAYYIHCLRGTEEAIRLLETAKKLTLSNNLNNKKLQNIIMENLATAYYYSGEFNKARQEIEMVQKRNGASELSYIILGHILYNECRYDESEAAYNNVLMSLNKNENLQALAVTHRSLGLVFYRKSQFSDPIKSKEYILLSKKHLEKSLDIHKLLRNENLEVAVSKHAYGRTAIKLHEFEKAENSLSDALRIAKKYCKKDEDHYEALVIKRSYGHFLCVYDKNRFDEGLKYLQEALDGKIQLFKDKPHQAVIGTMESIVDVYNRNPQNSELRKLMPRVVRYLNDWETAIKIDNTQQINKELIGGRIYTLKETIEKVNKENQIVL